MLKGIIKVGNTTLIIDTKEQLEKLKACFGHMTVVQAMRTINGMGLDLGA